MIDDDSQLTLLGGRLQYQSLHDALTGLPNRQYLTTRLESLLHSDIEHGVTLYHLDLDAFAVITEGLGREIGDEVLKLVAERLSSVFAAEKAMVARLEGDEFAVPVENGPTRRTSTRRCGPSSTSWPSPRTSVSTGSRCRRRSGCYRGCTPVIIPPRCCGPRT